MSYQNAHFDWDLDKAADLLDTTERREALQASEREMLNDYPIIPLYYFVSKRLVKPYLHGVVTNPFNLVPSKTFDARRPLNLPAPPMPARSSPAASPLFLAFPPGVLSFSVQ